MVREGVLLGGLPPLAFRGLECIDAGTDPSPGELVAGPDGPAPADQVEGEHTDPARADPHQGPLLREEFTDQGCIIMGQKTGLQDRDAIVWFEYSGLIVEKTSDCVAVGVDMKER